MLRRALTISTAAIFSLVLGFSAANAAFNPNAADPVAEAQRELAAAGTDAAALQALAEAIAAIGIPLTPAQIAALQNIIAAAEARIPGADFSGLASQVGEGTAGVPGTPGQVAQNVPNSGTASEDASDLLPTPPQASAN